VNNIYLNENQIMKSNTFS